MDFSVPQEDHPDEVVLDPSMSSEQFRKTNSLSMKQHPSHNRTTNFNNIQRPRSSLARNRSPERHKLPQTPLNAGIGCQNPLIPTVRPNNYSTAASIPSDTPPIAQQARSSSTGRQTLPPPFPQNTQSPTVAHYIKSSGNEHVNVSESELPVGFFTARAAESLQSGPGFSDKVSAFNPHLESPSIRKTAGVDHTKTKPIGREIVSGMTTTATTTTSVVVAAAAAALPRANFINPQTDKLRRLGMPGGDAMSLQNRGSYKPPSMKRPIEMNEARSALNDVTVASVNGASGDGGDMKRQRIGVKT